MAERSRRIPEATVARLPVYLRALVEESEAKATTISSERLAELAGVNAAKVRKDLSYLGSYGTRGVGYDVEYLMFQMSRELGLTHDWPVIIVGAGNLGQALANYGGFRDRGFPIAALVDADPDKVGEVVHGVEVRALADLDDLVTELGHVIGVIATPAHAAQEVADRLAAAGVTSVLNFAPAIISVPDGVSLRKVDLAVELQILSFYQQRREGGPEAEDASAPPDPRTAAADPPIVAPDPAPPTPAGTGRLYPVGVRLEGRPVLVVGGGGVAAAKARELVDCGARVTVVAPAIVDELTDDPRITCEHRRYRRGEAAEHRFVVTATDDPAVNQAVYDDGDAAGVWVNAADDPQRCSVTLPARVRRGSLLLTVSTEGRSPALASYLRRWLEDEVGPEHEVLLDLLAEERDRIRATGATSEGLDWQGALQSGMLDEIRAGRISAAKELLKACLSSSSA